MNEVFKKRGVICFDSDGTLGEWNKEKTLEEVMQDGYFRTIKPIRVMCNVLLALYSIGVPVAIVTATPEDGHSEGDKKFWFNEQGFGRIPTVFVPYGKRKGDYIVEQGNLLVDDYGVNLKAFNGTPVKFYNGINGNGGTKYRHSISRWMTEKEIMDVLLAVRQQATDKVF